MMERTYTIPLRREWIKTVRYKRAKKTIAAIRDFMAQHMKATDVKIGKQLNEEVWKHGIANPPSKIRVDAKKDKDGVVTVELAGVMKPKKADVADKKPADKTPAKEESEKVQSKEAAQDDKTDAKAPSKDDKPTSEKPKTE